MAKLPERLSDGNSHGVEIAHRSAPQERAPTVLPPRRGKENLGLPPKGLRIGVSSKHLSRESDVSSPRTRVKMPEVQGDVMRIELVSQPAETSGGLVVVRQTTTVQALLQEDLRWGIARKNPWKLLIALAVLGSAVIGFQAFRVIEFTRPVEANPIVEEPIPDLMEGFIIRDAVSPAGEMGGNKTGVDEKTE
jgi:hypothetical protein